MTRAVGILGIGHYVPEKTVTNFDMEKIVDDIEKIKSIKELENSTEIKAEFLKQFEKYAGFSLPEYFILPESNSSNKV